MSFATSTFHFHQRLYVQVSTIGPLQCPECTLNFSAQVFVLALSAMDIEEILGFQPDLICFRCVCPWHSSERDKNCLAAIFAPRHQSVSSGPLGGFWRWGSVDLGEGVSGPEAKKARKSLEKVSRARGPESLKKVSKKVRKVSKKHFQPFFDFSDLFWDFFGLLGPAETPSPRSTEPQSWRNYRTRSCLLSQDRVPLSWFLSELWKRCLFQTLVLHTQRSIGLTLSSLSPQIPIPSLPWSFFEFDFSNATVSSPRLETATSNPSTDSIPLVTWFRLGSWAAEGGPHWKRALLTKNGEKGQKTTKDDQTPNMFVFTSCGHRLDKDDDKKRKTTELQICFLHGADIGWTKWRKRTKTDEERWKWLMHPRPRGVRSSDALTQMGAFRPKCWQRSGTSLGVLFLPKFLPQMLGPVGGHLCQGGTHFSKIMGSRIRSLGTTPISGKNALGAKRPFSELSESSGVFSEQLSEFEIPFSEYEIPFSEWHPTTWAIRKRQFSEQLSERFPELVGARMKDFHLPFHSRSVFSRIGVVPVPKTEIGVLTTMWKEQLEEVLFLGRVPTTPGPASRAEVSWYKWEVYPDTFKKHPVRGWFNSPEFGF